MREILLLVVLDVNPTWINRKGEAERKFFFGGYQNWKELNISKGFVGLKRGFGK